jgi:L-rhamnose mutarotase
MLGKETATMKRYGQIIGVRTDRVEEYKAFHAEVWPEVLQMIRDCNIRNYSIFYRDGLLFAYFEYVGDDFDADMTKMAADPKTQEWWDIISPYRNPWKPVLRGSGGRTWSRFSTWTSVLSTASFRERLTIARQVTYAVGTATKGADPWKEQPTA